MDSRLPSRRPSSCQRVPNSPPPRILAMTRVPPHSSHSFPKTRLIIGQKRHLEAAITVEVDGAFPVSSFGPNCQ